MAFVKTTPVASPIGNPHGAQDQTKNERPKNRKVRISNNISVLLYMFAILANIELNLKLKIYKIAI